MATSPPAGVAKATLYNHFRTKDDVLSALSSTPGSRPWPRRAPARPPSTDCRPRSSGGRRAGRDPALRRVASEEPDLLLPLLSRSRQAPALVAEVLRAAGAASGPDRGGPGRALAGRGLLRPTSSAALVSAALDAAGGATGALPAGAVPPQARPAGSRLARLT